MSQEQGGIVRTSKTEVKMVSFFSLMLTFLSFWLYDTPKFLEQLEQPSTIWDHGFRVPQFGKHHGFPCGYPTLSFG